MPMETRKDAAKLERLQGVVGAHGDSKYALSKLNVDIQSLILEMNIVCERVIIIEVTLSSVPPAAVGTLLSHLRYFDHDLPSFPHPKTAWKPANLNQTQNRE